MWLKTRGGSLHKGSPLSAPRVGKCLLHSLSSLWVGCGEPWSGIRDEGMRAGTGLEGRVDPPQS